MMFTMLVCGGRDYDDECKLSQTLLDLCDKRGLWDTGHQHWCESQAIGLRMVAGECQTGADAMAKEWARWWIPKNQYQGYPADWGRFGLRAGPIRNAEMLRCEKVDLVVGFPTKKSKGTWDMIFRAQKARIEVRVIR